MTFAAVLSLDEAEARSLADVVAEDDELATRPVDLNETAPGQWQVVVYFEAEPEAGDREALARAITTALGRRRAAFRIEALPETDWVRRSLAGLKPIRVGRFLIHGRHDRDRVRPNDVAVEIEAGEAFGTGHHGSTLGCLAAIDALARRRQRVGNALDVGTGTGILAIAIARGLHAPVLATEIDPVATAVAAANARLNRAAGLITTVTAADLSGRLVGERGRFDLIVANILAGPLIRLAPSVRRHLAAGGTVILSGLLPTQRARVVAAYRGQGLRLVRAATSAGWLTLVFERRSIRTAEMRGRPPRAPRAGGRRWQAKRRQGP
jgi:ribosomal protein L11 methyltransferase